MNRQSESIKQHSFDNYTRKTIAKYGSIKKMKIQDKSSNMKFIAYAYPLLQPFKHISLQVQKDISQYQLVQEDGLAKIEEVFLTTIKQKKYVVFTRKLRQSPTLAQIVSSQQKKSTLDIMQIAITMTQLLQKLQARGIKHNNLSLETVQYCRKAIIIDLPIFKTLKKEAQRQCQVKQKQCLMKEDVTNFLQILLKLSIEKGCDKKKLDLQNKQTLKLIKSIKIDNIRNLLKMILVDKSINLKSINFQFILNFLKEGKAIPLKQSQDIGYEPTHSNFESKSLQTDILNIPIFPWLNCHQTTSMKEVSDKIIFDKTYQLQNSKISVKLFDNHSLLFDLSSRYSEWKSSIIINKQSKLFPFRKYFKDNQQFVDLFLKKDKGKFVLTTSGYLCFPVDKDYAKLLQTALRLETTRTLTQKNLFPENCIGFIYQSSLFIGRCFLINQNTIITTASSLYNRKKKKKRTNLVFSLPSCRGNCVNFVYPPEYESCSDKESYKYNYGVALLDKLIVKRQMHLSIVYNYDEEVMKKAVFEQKLQQFRYLINSNYFNHSQLELKDGKIQRFSSQFEEGSPLILSAGKKIVIVGMKTSKNSGFLFEQKHANEFIKFMHRLNKQRIAIAHSRIYDFKHFNYQQSQVKDYDQKIYQILQTKKTSISELCRQFQKEGNITSLIILIERAIINPYLFSQLKIKYGQLLTALYQKHYGPKHWKLSFSLCQLGYGHQKKNNVKQSIKHYKQALQFEQNIGRNNPVLVSQICFSLGNQLQQSSNSDAEKYYKKALTIYQKTGSYEDIGRCYHNLGSYYEGDERINQSIECFKKALQFKQKYSQEQDLVASLIKFTNIAIKNDMFEEGFDALKKLIKIAQKSTKKRMLIKEKTHNVWKILMQKANKSKVSNEIRQSMAKIQKFYPEQQQTS